MSFAQKPFCSLEDVLEDILDVALSKQFIFHWRPDRTTVGERLRSSPTGRWTARRCSKTLKTFPTEVAQLCENESPPMADSRQQQPRLNFALLVSVCVLFTYCFQVGQVIYVYIHFGEFYDCVYGCAGCCAVAAVLSAEPSLKISTFCVYKSCRFL